VIHTGNFGNNHKTLRITILLFSLVLVACASLRPTSNGVNSNLPAFATSGAATSTPFQPESFLSPSPLSSPSNPFTPENTYIPAKLWVSTAVPDALRQFAMGLGLPLADDPANAAIRLDITRTPDSNSSEWIYALVAPFPTITDGVSLIDIHNTWGGAGTGPFAGYPFWMDASTLAAFSTVWGAPAAGSVRVIPEAQLLDSAWADRPSWAIIPFESLEPRWKVLTVDGQSPIHKDFDLGTYPLKINFSLDPPEFPLLSGNRDPNKLTVVAMTGTTALVRATADRMERHGVLYPGEEIRTILRSADITHISNEVSFAADCPAPDQFTDSLQFCSNPVYIALLDDIGTDVVELTGNHLLDYGPKPFLTTLDMYDQRGWLYYGGGRDLQAALQPALLEDHGNKIAFVGCNLVGPSWDWATGSSPGSAPCDLDQLSVEISNLHSAGYIPIMTFQYSEYYQSNPTDYERRDFLKMAAAGAVIVSGSQAHFPAAMEFSASSFVHYGLGNLFFDQMSHLMPDGTVVYDTRDGFVDRHVFYDGRYISTELVSYMIEDYSRPRLMTESERQVFLKKIFSAGGW
jgi:poly-gamma-glutamate synthesis protein (capsule biosynthesis protein)